MLGDVFRDHNPKASIQKNESSSTIAVRAAAGERLVRAAAAREAADNAARRAADLQATQARDRARAARIEAILGSEEAVGREAAAERLAYETDLSVEDASDTLANIACNPQGATRSAGGYLDQFLEPSRPVTTSARKPTIYEAVADRRRNFLAGR